MIYYTQQARDAAMLEIENLVKKIATVKGSELSYLESSATIKYLNLLHDQIEKEFREAAKRGE